LHTEQPTTATATATKAKHLHNSICMYLCISVYINNLLQNEEMEMQHFTYIYFTRKTIL